MKDKLFVKLVASLKEGGAILCVPEGQAMVLLRVADKHPDAVLDAGRLKG